MRLTACPKCGKQTVIAGRCRAQNCGTPPSGHLRNRARTRHGPSSSKKKKSREKSVAAKKVQGPVHLIEEGRTPKGTPITVPEKVNHRDYGGHNPPHESLQVFLGYSRAKKFSEDDRRATLRDVFYAGPFVHSKTNARYVEAFGAPATKHRAEFLLKMLERSHKAEDRYMQDRNHRRHAAAMKLRDDIAWLKAEIQSSTWS